MIGSRCQTSQPVFLQREKVTLRPFLSSVLSTPTSQGDWWFWRLLKNYSNKTIQSASINSKAGISPRKWMLQRSDRCSSRPWSLTLMWTRLTLIKRTPCYLHWIIRILPVAYYADSGLSQWRFSQIFQLGASTSRKKDLRSQVSVLIYHSTRLGSLDQMKNSVSFRKININRNLHSLTCNKSVVMPFAYMSQDCSYIPS